MKFIKKTFVFLATIPIYLYKAIIKPFFPSGGCKFTPTCSQYCKEAIVKHGVISGWVLGLKRIARCNPKNRDSSLDPVPDNIKGDIKWTL